MNTNEFIYNKIRDDITYGKIKPGERLFELELTKKYGISRTPIREAIRQLQSEGLLDVIPNKGARVTKLSIRELDEIYSIRAILEKYAVKLAAEKIKKIDLAKIIETQKKLEKNASEKDYIKYLENNIKFHFLFPKISGNQSLFQLIKDLRMRVYRYQYITLTIPNNLNLWLEQHQQIIDALINNDAELAAKNMERHLEKIKRLSIDFLKKFPQGL
jgi:DNA-binding GntR family transcriptional regulator